ncbi:MAG TPA: DNA-processing protein DprA [Polyangiaceae bacterium]|nr:DNA-processing protein DprA [Polyangiaceae bacterium]
MTPLLHLTPLDRLYPLRLRSLARPPASLTVRGGSLEAPCAVAIVGSRAANGDATAFSRNLAATLVRSGAVVVSGGAIGIDAAAHRGALDAGGRTWAVAGTGCEHCFPPEHASLFDTIGEGPGAMVWPFPPAAAARAGGFVLRNRVLVALSDAVVVVQAGIRSGALRAAECARALKRPLWVVPAPPWAVGFEGSRQLLDQGARALTGCVTFLRTLALHDPEGSGGAASPMPEARGNEPVDPIQSAVLCAISSVPSHIDEIALKAHATVQVAAAALLTLALEAVVVEGPPGFFRRRDSYKQ